MTRGGADVVVAEELLDGANVVAVLEEVRGKGVAQGVTGGPFGKACADHGQGDGSLEHGLVKVMPATLPRGWMDVGSGRGKDPLPRPRLRCAGKLRGEGGG